VRTPKKEGRENAWLKGFDEEEEGLRGGTLKSHYRTLAKRLCQEPRPREETDCYLQGQKGTDRAIGKERLGKSLGALCSGKGEKRDFAALLGKERRGLLLQEGGE